MRDRVGRAYWCGGWKNVGGGGMGVPKAVGKSRSPVPYSKWSLRQATADSHADTHRHR